MLHDDRQRARTCEALLSSLGLDDDLWTIDGPSQEAVTILNDDGGVASSGERVLLLIAGEIWDYSTGLKFGELFRLDSVRLKLVATLLAALASGPRAVDEWLAEHVTP